MPIFHAESCFNVFDRACDKLNIQGQSLSSSVWGGRFNWENLPGSLGYELEDQYYKDQLELLTDQKHKQEPYMNDLQDLYKSCFTYKKSDFYESPLIKKVFSTCGGDSIFEPATEIKKDIEQVLADLQTKFGVSSAFSIPFDNDFRIDPMFYYKFDKASMNQIYRNLHNNREPDQGFSKIADEIIQLQSEINSRQDFTYGPISYTKSEMKARLQNSTVDWVKYIELSVTNSDFNVRMNLRDLKTVDNVIKKYGKKIFLGYVFFGALEYLEIKLNVKVYGKEGKQEVGHRFTEKQCFEMTTMARLSFFAQYFKRHGDVVKERAIEQSGQELIKNMAEIVDESKQITEEAKKNIVEKLESLQIIAQYPSILKDEKVIQTYIGEVNLRKFDNFFEKMTSILGTNFRFATKFYFETSKANFLWWTKSSVDHKLGSISYDRSSHAISERIMCDDPIRLYGAFVGQ
uniref:Uncharacterized protein n=1 Tax=Romanomermis culicivorax TaxID=13658 RepID=A0A915HUA5_ROMCU